MIAIHFKRFKEKRVRKIPLPKVPILTLYELAVKRMKKKPNQVESKLSSFDDLICRMKAARLPRMTKCAELSETEMQSCWSWKVLITHTHFWSVQTANENGNYRIVRLHAIGAENRREDRRKSISCSRRQWEDSSLLKTPLNTFQTGISVCLSQKRRKNNVEKNYAPPSKPLKFNRIRWKRASLDAMWISN